MWTTWIFWIITALVLAILEVLAPAFIFLGFAIGAAIVGLLFLFGGPFVGAMTASLPVTILVFAVLSLISWIALRQLLGVRKGQVKVWTKDINEP
ncbi:MAG: hypothetical protein AAF891_03250 [Pseudomonadota bacterium]